MSQAVSKLLEETMGSETNSQLFIQHLFLPTRILLRFVLHSAAVPGFRFAGSVSRRPLSAHDCLSPTVSGASYSTVPLSHTLFGPGGRWPHSTKYLLPNWECQSIPGSTGLYFLLIFIEKGVILKYIEIDENVFNESLIEYSELYKSNDSNNGC